MKLSSSILALFAALSLDASACSYPEPASFSEALSEATTVFVFRVEATRLVRQEEAHSEWVEADIRVVEMLKGEQSLARIISFSTHWCGGHRLDTGHYFLIAASADSTRLELVPDDRSVIDISRYYAEGDPEATANADVIPVVQRALAGSPLPPDFPWAHLAHRSLQIEASPLLCTP